jgi:hypothetical protein
MPISAPVAGLISASRRRLSRPGQDRAGIEPGLRAARAPLDPGELGRVAQVEALRVARSGANSVRGLADHAGSMSARHPAASASNGTADDLFGRHISSSTIWLTKEELAPFSSSRRTR